MLNKIKAHYQKHKLKRAQKKEENQRKREYVRNYPSAFDDGIITWTTPEHLTYERGIIWKLCVFFVTAGAISWGIFDGAWTFSGAIFAFVLAYYLTHYKKQSKDVIIRISDIGIKVGNRKYPYTHIKAFWLIYQPPYVATLNLKVTGETFPEVTIQLNGNHPGPIREFLITKIPELEGQHERMSDIFVRLFKL